MSTTDFPNLRAELVKKRNALDDVIRILDTNFAAELAAGSPIEVDEDAPPAKRKYTKRKTAGKGKKQASKQASKQSACR